MWKILQVALLIVLPLALGLGAEFIFERFRRRRGERQAPEEDGWPHDWII